MKLSLCFTKHHPMKICWGSEGIAPRILNLGTLWRLVVSFTPRPLYPRNPPRYPLNRKLGGPQSKFGRSGEEKKPLLLSGIEPHSLVSILTELPWLRLNYVQLFSNGLRRGTRFWGSYSNGTYPMGTRGSFPGGKVAGAWSWPLTSI
jgi:hypothetical protein